MQFIEFVFSGFWIFIGTLWLIIITLDGIASIISAWRK